MIEAGTILQNRYRIGKQIGQGGMGAVYLATDERFKSTVAIKETLFLDEKYCRAFEREARLLNSLRHPALPIVSDHFVEGNGQFIVMEYIAGEDLAEQLAKNGQPFPLEDVLVWADQLLDALDFLHNQESPVIHRDIKPQNLKLTKRNQIILLDFGLAKGNPTDVSNHTAAKSIFGYSPGYASLEQIQGTGTEPRSDLYSLAATLYHLLTGIPPTDALTRAMSVLNEKDDPLQPANLINRKIPAGVAEVLQKAMALNANHRPETAGNMRDLLVDCDKSGNSENGATFSEKALPTDIFTRKTRLFTDASVPQSEIKTEVFNKDESNPDISRETRLNDREAGITQTGGMSRYTVGAAIFGVLLILGAGLYALNVFEDHSGRRSENENRLPENNISTGSVTAAVDVTNTGNISANKVSDSNIRTAVSAPPGKETKTQTVPAQKTPETAENTPQKAKSARDSKEPFVFYDPEEGNVKIYTDRIETENAIIEGNRITLKKGGKTTVVQPLNPNETKELTPAQKAKLFRLRQLQKQYPKPPLPPPPKPTPEN